MFPYTNYTPKKREPWFANKPGAKMIRKALKRKIGIKG